MREDQDSNFNDVAKVTDFEDEMKRVPSKLSLVVVVMALILGLVVATGCKGHSSSGSASNTGSVSSSSGASQWSGTWVGVSCQPPPYQCQGSPSAYSIELRSDGSCTFPDPTNWNVKISGHWQIGDNEIDLNFGPNNMEPGDRLFIHGNELYDYGNGFILERE
jgi:hypothetical protein